MAKLKLTLNVPDNKFDPSLYPDCETAVECINYDLEQIEAGELSETELIDIYLGTGAEIESFTADE